MSGRAGEDSVKRTLRHCVMVVLALGALGFVAVLAGLAPVAASAGHWAITDVVLHFAMRQAVKVRALRIAAPADYDEPRQVQKGAGHFATACQPCHGAPGNPAWGTMRHMSPPPPGLQARIGEWKAEELFWIVRHGIKFTGMPAWPSDRRDDEVWAVVGFLRQLPRLTPEEYAALVTPPDEETTEARALDPALRTVVAACAVCHGFDGAGRGDGAYPRLAGQSREYLAATLDAFAKGRRHSGMMQAVAAGLNMAQRRTLAEYYAGVSAPVRNSLMPSERADRGASIARRGVPDKGVPSCTHCHGPGTAERNPFYPRLAGQYADYLVLQLQLFQQGHRGGTAYAHLMHESVRRMTREQMEDVAAYYASLPPDSSHVDDMDCHCQ